MNTSGFVYYPVRSGNGLIELRQVRFRADFERGVEDARDVCAVARDVDELRGMVERCGLGAVDWSALGADGTTPAG